MYIVHVQVNRPFVLQNAQDIFKFAFEKHVMKML